MSLAKKAPPKRQRSTHVCFFIPFAGPNHQKLGTRITFDLDRNLHSVSQVPQRRRRGDKQLSNSGRGLLQMYDTLSDYMFGWENTRLMLFHVFQELLVSHQRCQRQLA